MLRPALGPSTELSAATAVSHVYLILSPPASAFLFFPHFQTSSSPAPAQHKAEKTAFHTEETSARPGPRGKAVQPWRRERAGTTCPSPSFPKASSPQVASLWAEE